MKKTIAHLVIAKFLEASFLLWFSLFFLLRKKNILVYFRKSFEEDDCEPRKQDEEEIGDDEIDCIAEKFLCMSVHNRDAAIKPGKKETLKYSLLFLQVFFFKEA